MWVGVGVSKGIQEETGRKNQKKKSRKVWSEEPGGSRTCESGAFMGGEYEDERTQ